MGRGNTGVVRDFPVPPSGSWLGSSLGAVGTKPIRRSLDAAPGEEALRPDMTFAEILAPVREYSRRMGYTEEELDTVFEQAREEVTPVSPGP